ncbi:MAG: hygromycin-B [Candidatus Peregrinibacteria bacterium Greene1014_49]|nr:MAG: hygromycin-B [Candidatus Peregrinibacteria bacterium Greene1014_49]
MSKVKTRIDAEIVLQFLHEKFDTSLTALTLLKGGELSEAFSAIGSGKRDLIIRVNNNPETFAKDRFAYEHFCSATVPIPEVLFTGKMDNMFVCVTERMEGQTFNSLISSEQMHIIPKMLDCLEEIHATDIYGTTGFGRWNGQGTGMFPTWKDAILNILKQTIVNADWFSWEQLFQETPMERDMYAQVCKKIQELAKYLPEQRSLVHGDFGYDNLLVSGNAITAVIDWGEAEYGDPLYDIAWLDFHSQGLPFNEQAKKRIANMKHFDERLLCYKLCIGLGCLGFCTKAEKMEEYAATKESVLRLLAHAQS